MSILGRIENLQQAPPRKKMIVLTLSVLIIMSAIIGLWVMQLDYQYKRTAPTQTHEASITEPFLIIMRSTSETVQKGFSDGLHSIFR
ncbi:MAG: hypothetical protein AAB372_00510 [Patescibacteria group bacterium]